MEERVINELKREEHTPFHDELLRECKRLVNKSRAHMEGYYELWDNQQKVWAAERPETEEDRKSRKKEEPVKMVVPLTYAQVMTFVAVAMMLIKQKTRIYELKATGEEDWALKETAELMIERDLKYNKFSVILFQFLLYLCKCDLGIIEHEYVDVMQNVATSKTEGRVEVDGYVTEEGEEVVERKQMLKYSGNKLVLVSPYHFFPDPRVPLERFQEGEFVASECEMTKTALRELESQGVVAGIDHVSEFLQADLGRRENTRFVDIDISDLKTSQHNFCITKVQIKIVPKDFEVEGKPLGKESFPVKYLVWYANDQRIIRCEPMDYVHDEFTYDVARFTPDDMNYLSKSLTEMLANLQEAVDWFINSRISSVRRTLDNQLVIDPSGIEMSTVESRSRIILMKKGASRVGVDNYIKQLNVNDVTQSHISDANNLQGLMNVTTGVNDNAMGQFNGGRRSAREAGIVAQSAGARLRLSISLIWDMALAPLGEKMLLNLRAYLPEEQFYKVTGKLNAQQLGVQQLPIAAELFQQFHALPEDLVGSNDFFVFDGTLPSEKGFMAQALQELLSLLISNPQAAQQFDLSPKQVLESIMELNGTGKGKRFSFFNDPQQLQQLLAQVFQQGQLTPLQPAQPNAQPGPTAQPQES